VERVSDQKVYVSKENIENIRFNKNEAVVPDLEKSVVVRRGAT